MYKQSFSCKINCTEVEYTATKLHISPDETDMARSRSLLQKRDSDSNSTPPTLRLPKLRGDDDDDHGRRSRGDGGDNSPQNLERRGLSPQIWSCCKILSTILLALQCRKMCFLPLQQDFYSKPAMRPPELQSDLRL